MQIDLEPYKGTELAMSLAIDISKVKLEESAPDNKVELINNTIERVMDSSSFYKELKGLRKISSLEDIKNIPFTTRNDIKVNSPHGIRSSSMKDVVRYGQSNGTNGAYSSGFVTGSDWIENSSILYMGFSQVFSKSDIIMIAAPYELSFVAADFDRVAEIIGATTISVSSNHTKAEWMRILGIMSNVKVSVFASAATRILRLGLLAQEMGYDLKKDFNLKKVICVGELLSETKKKIIEDMWGCKVFITYGMTEATSVASPCKNGKLHLCECRYFFEIINPKTGEDVEDGELGELVLTSYNSYAMPLIRFRTGDMVKVDKTKDDCFLNYKRIIHFGRIDDYYLLNGNKVYTYDIEEIILSTNGISPLFHVSLEDNQLFINIFPLDSRDFNFISDKISKSFKKQYEIEPIIDLLDKERFLEEIDNKTKPGNVYFERGAKNENSSLSK